MPQGLTAVRINEAGKVAEIIFEPTHSIDIRDGLERE